ncbi:unnamed protein product [Caenorhabditis angaria]|uniref:RNA polymerase II subunit B1 CTD phosphatase RPAP2 homolog n=1 Tax=Caenorhabditis angaria TaxID=860376 RepID=A0A9P1IG49_9PELO|nr:unnamed protein product [Caenorhabditis angaria]
MTEELSSVKWRRKVLQITELLCETVNPEQLLESLPYLHESGWDELVEERSVNKTCGYPTCSRSCRPNNQKQLYHIDRKSGKIYENSNLRKKFCSDHCFDKSLQVRGQLETEALWITGENSRFDKSYVLPKDMVVEITEEKPRNILPKKVEIVQENDLLAKISNLKIKDEESDKEDNEDDENEEFKHIEPYEKCSDDEEFVNSIQKFVRTKECSTKSSPKSKSQPLPNSDKEKEIFEKLRSKYGKQNAKPKPIFIDPPKMLSEKQSKMSRGLKIEWISKLFGSWISDETRKMIKEGFRPKGGDIEQILMQFLGGAEQKLENKVDLPNLDKYNIREKRLNIFMQTIKLNWSELEARLDLNSTKKELMARFCATFNFDSENITGWTKQETNLIVATIFLALSQVDPEIEDDYCRNNQISGEFIEIAKQMCGDISFPDILKMIKNVIGTSSAC